MVKVKFSFWAYGILAIAALLSVLSFGSVQLGHGDWAARYFGVAVLIVIAYLVLSIMRRRSIDAGGYIL